MKTLDFSASFKGVDGQDTDTKLSKSLAELLASENVQANAVKLLGWVESLRTKDTLELDEPDFKLLETIVEQSTRMIVLLKGQLLRCFLNAK